MKRILFVSVALLMLMMSGCTKKEEPADQEEIVMVRIETEGVGEFCYAMEGEELNYDETVSASYMQVLPGSEIKVGSRNEDDEWMFSEWIVNGEIYSTEPEVSFTVTGDTDIIAVFALFSGYDGPAVSSINEARMIGDVLALPSYSSMCSEDTFVYVFELNDVIYRAIANIPKETSDAIWELELGDSDYDRLFNELVAPLKIAKIENISAAIPSQDELDKYVGQTGQVLIDEDCSDYYCNYDEMEFGLIKGLFKYLVRFNGEARYSEGQSWEDAVKDKEILSVTYDGLGDAANPDIPVK